MGKKLVIKGADFSANGIVSEYLELAWIGSGALNTSALKVSGISSACKIVQKFNFYVPKIKNNPGSGYVCGALYTGTYFTAGQTSAGAYAYFDGGSNYARNTSTNIGNGNDITLEISPAGLKINNDAIVAPSSPVGSYTPNYIGLDGCVNNLGNYTSVSISEDNDDPAMRLKSVKIYSDYTDESSLVVDAIPVKRNSDGVVCLYNKVNGTYIERTDGTQPAYGELE